MADLHEPGQNNGLIHVHVLIMCFSGFSKQLGIT